MTSAGIHWAGPGLGEKPSPVLAEQPELGKDPECPTQLVQQQQVRHPPLLQSTGCIPKMMSEASRIWGCGCYNPNKSERGWHLTLRQLLFLLRSFGLPFDFAGPFQHCPD